MPEFVLRAALLCRIAGGGVTRLWRLLRQATGDDAFERYVEHCRQAHPDRPLPDRHQFQAARQAEKWRGISRCC